MSTAAAVLVLTLCLLSAPLLAAPPASQPARAGADNGWDAKFFAYDRSHPVELVVSTPTASQMSFVGRPAVMKAPAINAGDAVRPLVVGPVDVLHVTFKDASGAWVPALLATPSGQAGPFPLVVAIHGLRSN
ncbi:MAG TPA: hypothetical protein VK324_06645, partial [Tepidisphaeraceae bacterium]|nr:hypothetical protein [Tepidisphaeraceae bacterium]